jgi:hypothetical protein
MKYHSIGNCGGMEIYIYTFLILMLDESIWLISRSTPVNHTGITPQ